MKDDDAYSWAKALGDNLTVLGERVPLERALKSYVGDIEALRARGMTWRSIASSLLRVGVTRENGQPYSGDHLRTSYARARKALLLRSGDVATTPKTKPTFTDGRFPATSLPLPVPVQGRTSAVTDKDISDEEVSKALFLLKINSR